MPKGREDDARGFYSGLLGLPERPKPAELLARGGVWFETAAVKIHLGVEPEFRPAQKAHPGLLVDDLRQTASTLRAAGYEVRQGEPLAGFDHAYVDDPFGNRIELLQRL